MDTIMFNKKLISLIALFVGISGVRSIAGNNVKENILAQLNVESKSDNGYSKKTLEKYLNYVKNLDEASLTQIASPLTRVNPSKIKNEEAKISYQEGLVKLYNQHRELIIDDARNGYRLLYPILEHSKLDYSSKEGKEFLKTIVEDLFRVKKKKNPTPSFESFQSATDVLLRHILIKKKSEGFSMLYSKASDLKRKDVISDVLAYTPSVFDLEELKKFSNAWANIYDSSGEEEKNVILRHLKEILPLIEDKERKMIIQPFADKLDQKQLEMLRSSCKVTGCEVMVIT